MTPTSTRLLSSGGMTAGTAAMRPVELTMPMRTIAARWLPLLALIATVCVAVAPIACAREPDWMPVSNAVFSPDGQLVATASAIWDVRTGRLLHQLGTSSEWIDTGAVAFGPGGHRLV